MAKQKYASFAAKDTREAGSLPTDFDGTITNVKFTKEAPDNYQADGNPIFQVVTIVSDAGGQGFAPGVNAQSPIEERTVVQSYNLGGTAGNEFTISDDGYGLIPVDDSVTATRKGSKADLFKCSLENEGVSSAIFEEGDWSKVFGLYGHWKRINDDVLLGKAREFNDDKKKKSKFPPQTLVLVKLLTMPGEKAVGKTNGAVTQATTSPAAASGEDFDLDTATFGYLTQVLDKAKDKRAQRSQLTLLVSKAAMNDTNRQPIAKRAQEEAYLIGLAEAGVVKYDPAAKPQYVSL